MIYEELIKLENLTEKVFIDNKPCELLTEANLSRVTKGHNDSGFVIISPCRSKDNLEKELGKKLNDQQFEDENNKRYKELKNTIYSYGYSFIPVYGGYHEEGSEETSYEKSFIVYPFNKKEEKDFEEMFNEMMKLGKRYNQDSILRKAPNENPSYINCSTGEKEMEFHGTSLNDISNEYFTALRKDNKGNNPKRFSFEGLYVNPANSIMDGHMRSSQNELVYHKK